MIQLHFNGLLIYIYLSQEMAAGSISLEDLGVTGLNISFSHASQIPFPNLHLLFQMATSLGQLTVIVPQVLTNPLQATGNRASGLMNTGRQEAPPTVASPSGVEQQTSGGGAKQLNNNRVPAGLELATQGVPTVQGPARPTRSAVVWRLQAAGGGKVPACCSQNCFTMRWKIRFYVIFR